MTEADGRGDAPFRPLTRRRFLQAAVGSTALLLVTACGGATAPAAKTETRPAETKPAESKPTSAAAAKPAAGASPAVSASPAAGASPAPQASPASTTTGALPNLRGTSLSVLQWTGSVPAAEEFFKKQIEDDFMKKTGATVTVEFVNANDLQPKIAASIQAGSGPDLVLFQYNWAHLYQDSVVDVSDIVDEYVRAHSSVYPGLEVTAKVNGKWLDVPHHVVPNAVHWRKSWFKEVGADSFPKTFDDLFAVGKKLKDKGHPLGQALSHSFGDPPTFAYPLFWAYGGREVDQSGKVAINSPETTAAVKAMAAAWPAAFDETGLGWDDSSNNRAFLAETISGTVNGTSIWWAARDQKLPFFDDIAMDLVPAGPKGAYVFMINHNYAIMKYSKNVEGAKAFIRWAVSDPVWMPWFEVNGGYIGGVSEKQDNDSPWNTFPPAVQSLKGSGSKTRTPGYAGPYNQQAGLAQSKYVIVDMFARAVQGTPVDQTIAQAEQELKEIYV
ncbi:MAG: extracellular solute-binding protein [Chloroflexi bacterium]|nr:extracellular solute-binding protein [Chloroflexota bacterium]